DELERAAVLPARTVKQFSRSEGGDADEQDAQRRADPLDVEENVLDRADHQRRQQAEQIAVLQRRREHREQLADLGRARRMRGPIARQKRRRQQQPEAAQERPDRRENQIAFHASSSRLPIAIYSSGG